MSQITRFQVIGLHGRRNFDLRFKDNSLILVGENGTGKSTILQLLFYLLSGQLTAMLKYEFESLKITINNKSQTLNYSDLDTIRKKSRSKSFKRLPPYVRDKLMHRGIPSITELERISDRYDIPVGYLINIIDEDIEMFKSSKDQSSGRVNKMLESIMESLGAQVLFLPTYRRIEQELQSIFKGLDDRELRPRDRHLRRRGNLGTYVELVEFGMKDVDDAIKYTASELEKFAREELNKLTISYLGNIVEHEYKSIDLAKIKNTDDGDIENVLNRIQEPILTKENKNRLREIIRKVKNGVNNDEHDRIVCHYFTKLMKFHQVLEGKEKSIVNFCKICNDYMVNKKFEYNSSTYNFSIEENYKNDEAQTVELHQLSSGEKQIVSLFSHLYLSGGSNNYFVLIDEPELSLSVPWQRKFLRDIKNADFCSGLVAVTHSPFIYDNELEKYAHGLDEFNA
jgi:predicted ATPase